MVLWDHLESLTQLSDTQKGMHKHFIHLPAFDLLFKRFEVWVPLQQDIELRWRECRITTVLRHVFQSAL